MTPAIAPFSRRPRALPALATPQALCALLATAPAAQAALSDEIQVYTDDINAPKEFGLELHTNYTISGRRTPDYPGEAVPHHGLRITPEFSYGLTPTLEAGLYLPVNHDANGNTEAAGLKLRLKWLPIRGDEEAGGWFLGVNGELSRLRQAYSESRNSFELRVMAGYRSPQWLVAVNPVFGWNLSDGYRGQSPDFSLATKVARTIAPGVQLGAELYMDMGTTANILPLAQQGNTLYAALDFKVKGWDINLGLGKALTSSADNYTVKAIFGIPF